MGWTETGKLRVLPQRAVRSCCHGWKATVSAGSLFIGIIMMKKVICYGSHVTGSNDGLIPEFSEKSQKRHINSARPGWIGPGNSSFEVGKDITATLGSGCIGSQTTYLSYLLTKDVVTFVRGYRWVRCDFCAWVSVTFVRGCKVHQKE